MKVRNLKKRKMINTPFEMNPVYIFLFSKFRFIISGYTHLPSSKHCTIFPINGMQVLAGDVVNDLLMTPVQI